MSTASFLCTALCVSSCRWWPWEGAARNASVPAVFPGGCTDLCCLCDCGERPLLHPTELPGTSLAVSRAAQCPTPPAPSSLCPTLSAEGQQGQKGGLQGKEGHPEISPHGGSPRDSCWALIGCHCMSHSSPRSPREKPVRCAQPREVVLHLQVSGQVSRSMTAHTQDSGFRQQSKGGCLEGCWNVRR